MKNISLCFATSTLLSMGLQAQVCDPSVAPTGLVSTYIPGSGALLEWNTVPGSVGVQLKVDLPSGSSINRRIMGFERDQFAVPDALLSHGTYTWRVQAACSSVPPFNVTPISASSSFTVGGGSSCPATVTDIDGNVYSTVEIGSQCWMAENLKVERYRNGDNIPTGLSSSSWGSTTSGAFAVYDNNAANKVIYGLLYNGYAAADPRALCPTSWHVPTDEEWTTLTEFLGGFSIAGGNMKTTGTLEAGSGLWFAPNAAATNSSGFSGIPGGVYTGTFFSLGNSAYYWSSTESSTGRAWWRGLFYLDGNFGRTDGFKLLGQSVRCLKTSDGAANIPPQAEDDLASTNQDNTVSIPVLANDSDSDGTLEISSVSIVAGPFAGTASVFGVDGSITYTPNAGFFGLDSLRYRVCDNDGACAQATVRITVVCTCCTLSDIDGNVYGAVQIGSQCWMAENLRVEHYRNGNPIPTGLSNSAWQSTTSGAFAFPDNNSTNVAEYGLLYNWFAVDDAQNLCPTGWRVPFDDDWHDLANFLDPAANPGAVGSAESISAGGKMKESGTVFWNTSSPGATNESGFSIRGAGYRSSLGTYVAFRTSADFWSLSTCTTGCSASGGCANSRGFNSTSDAMFRNCGFAPKKSGFSVRCIKL